VYKLPQGLPEGVRVRTVGVAPAGRWIVERLDQPGGTRWSVYMILLEVVADQRVRRWRRIIRGGLHQLQRTPMAPVEVGALVLPSERTVQEPIQPQSA